MTDKEQVMIDGVDVSGCEYACNTAFGKNGCKHPMMKNIYCSKNPNCYFKQLARKTQELEQYKTSKQASYEALQKQCNELELQNRKLKQECEALKSESFTREELITIQEKDIDRYRKVLEEIAKIVTQDRNIKDVCLISTCLETGRVAYDIQQQIIDIINKAKGE